MGIKYDSSDLRLTKGNIPILPLSGLRIDTIE
jgi:hypothetical protein